MRQILPNEIHSDGRFHSLGTEAVQSIDNVVNFKNVAQTIRRKSACIAWHSAHQCNTWGFSWYKSANRIAIADETITAISPSADFFFKSRHDVNTVKYMAVIDLFRDFDDLFARCMLQCNFRKIIRNFKLTMKSKNTIASRGPMRLANVFKSSEGTIYGVTLRIPRASCISSHITLHKWFPNIIFRPCLLCVQQYFTPTKFAPVEFPNRVFSQVLFKLMVFGPCITRR